MDIRGFERFTVKQREARTERNPQTGEPGKIPAKRVPALGLENNFRKK
jgi:nucleoid DNA-binding protein